MKHEPNDEQYDCYTYIMNTQVLYKALGEVLLVLIQRAVRLRRTLELEARMGMDSVRWMCLARVVIGKAELDYRKHFSEEDPQPHPGLVAGTPETSC